MGKNTGEMTNHPPSLDKKGQEKECAFIILLLAQLVFDRQLFNQKDHLVSRKKKVPFSMAKWGTHARVFSQTIARENSKNEKDKETDEEGKKGGVSMESSMIRF